MQNSVACQSCSKCNSKLTTHNKVSMVTQYTCIVWHMIYITIIQYDPVWLMTNIVSYNLVTDINYIITAIITPNHKIRDMNSYISQLPKGKRITNVIWTVLYWFLRIGVVFLPVFSTGCAFRIAQGRRCMLADRQNTMFLYSRSYEGVQMKWKVEIQIHWIECISVDTLACKNEWNMRYVCPLVKHQRRFQSLMGTIWSLVLNICFTFWKKWSLNRLQIYLRSDCMGYQCHTWRNTLITTLFLKLHYLTCFRVVYAQAWHPHNIYNRWNRKHKWEPGENLRVDVVKM